MSHAMLTVIRGEGVLNRHRRRARTLFMKADLISYFGDFH